MSDRVVQGVISAGELYTMRQVQQRLGLTESALRELRRRGLPIRYVSKRGFASGKQVIEFFEKLFECESPGAKS